MFDQKRDKSNCVLCGEAAVCKDVIPLKKGKKDVYLHYCKGCRHAGLVFGFLDRIDLEELK